MVGFLYVLYCDSVFNAAHRQAQNKPKFLFFFFWPLVQRVALWQVWDLNSQTCGY